MGLRSFQEFHRCQDLIEVFTGTQVIPESAGITAPIPHWMLLGFP